MKTITIYRAYRKAVVKAQFASERSKRQRMRKLRYGRQYRYFEAKLIARIEAGDEARCELAELKRRGGAPPQRPDRAMKTPYVERTYEDDQGNLWTARFTLEGEPWSPW